MPSNESRPGGWPFEAPKKVPIPGSSRPKNPQSPPFLEAVEQGMWRDVVRLYDFSDAPSQALLRTALEAHQRGRRCRERIDKDGEAVLDRFGTIKAHPLLAAERDARAGFLAAMKALALDLTGVNK